MLNKLKNLRPKVIRFSMPVLILALGLFVFFILYITKSSTKPHETEETTWPVAIELVKETTDYPQLILFGKTESLNQAKLASAVTAFVQQKNVKEGDIVSEGQTLVILDPVDTNLLITQRQAQIQELEAAIASEHLQHQANLKNFQEEQTQVTLKARAVEREKTLHAKQLGAEAELDNTQIALALAKQNLIAKQLTLDDHENTLKQLTARLANAQAELQQAQLELQRTTIKAPFNGWVTQVLASPGERLQPGDPIIELFDLDRYQVRAQIPIKYANLIQACLTQRNCSGKNTLMATAYLNQQPIQLKLERISGAIDSGRGGIEALFHLTDNTHTLPIGRSLEIVFNLPEHPNLIEIPTEALYGNDRVYTIENDRMKAIRIQIVGEKFKSLTESKLLIVADNLKTGMPLITTQLPNAIDGLKVQVIE